MGCRLIGRWQIVAADLWRDWLDLCGPAMLKDIRADGYGEIAFGALQLAYGRSDVSFDWAGFGGSGSAELVHDDWRSSSTTSTATTPASMPCATSSAAC